ncbi:MAG: chromate resistance protein, partial [Alphaproteobacteria bacterium]|nr:chromate resistance protein [Alphaproteobacteria bacterium]
MAFIVLFVTLPTKAGTGRVRVWRSLRALGCAALRDGVYLLPEDGERVAALEDVAAEAVAAGGTAEVFRLEGRTPAQGDDLRRLFDRSAEYAGFVGEVRRFGAGLDREEGRGQIARRLNVLSRRLDQIRDIDFYPGESLRQATAALEETKAAAARILSPDEPSGGPVGPVARLEPADYRGRTWATRRHLWVDRMASAWLIRRHIDPAAAFVWLASPADCRPGWLGFDFDGAAFSHVGTRVTFETLLIAFALERHPGL